MKRIGLVAFGAVIFCMSFGAACSEKDDNEIEPGGDGGGSAASGGGTAEGGSDSGGEGNTESGGEGNTESGGNGGEETGGGGGTTGGGSGGSYTACNLPSEFEECGGDQEAAERVPTNVLLVMDKSGSMAQQPEGYSMDKWSAMSSALTSVLTEVRNDLSIGLEFFPTTAGDSPIPASCSAPGRCCEMPGGSEMNVDIGPGYNTVPQILSDISSADPAGGTPTATALARAFDYFDSGAGADLEGNKFVLLATDGGPNCNADLSCGLEECTLNIDDTADCPADGISCCGSNPEGCLDHDGTLQQIERLYNIGVQTIVVGIPGAEAYHGRLESYADVGGFTTPDGEVGYFEVPASGGVDELTSTFETITTQLVEDCDIVITDTVDNPNLVNVAVDCEVVNRGTEDDSVDVDHWYFDDPNNPTRIIIAGPICNTIRTEGVARIDTICMVKMPVMPIT